MSSPATSASADDHKPLVLLAQPLFPNLAAVLEGRYRLALAADADEATAGEARVLLVPGLKEVTAELIGRLPALELVVATSVGLDHVDLDACRRRGLAVTNAGAGRAVSGRGFKEYRLGDYSSWLRRRVEDGRTWERVRSCLAEARVCRSLQRNRTLDEFVNDNLSPVQVCNWFCQFFG